MDDQGREVDDEFADVGVAEDEVKSAARSCSAILIILIAVGLITCAAFALTFAF